MAVAAMLVKPAPTSGGIQVYLAGGSSLGGTGGTGHPPVSAPSEKHSGKTSASTSPAVSQRPQHHTVHHHRLGQRHRGTSKAKLQLRKRPSKTVAVPVHKHTMSHRKAASTRATQTAVRNESRAVRPKPVKPAPVLHTPHPPVRTPPRHAASGAAAHDGSTHHAAAGKGTGAGHGISTGSGPGNGTHGPNLRPYFAAIMARIQAAKHYPWVARRRRMQGVTRVAFQLSRTGKLLWTRVAHSSGYAILDKAAVAAVRNGAPYPKFPGTKTQMPTSIAVNLDFVLR